MEINNDVDSSQGELEAKEEDSNRGVAKVVEPQLQVTTDFYQSSNPYNVIDIINLTPKELKFLMEIEKRKNISTPIKGRSEAVYNEGIRFGTQSALYSFLFSFNNFTDKNSSQLSLAFPFSALMLFEGRVQPPIIKASRNRYEKENSLTISSIKESYTITDQVRVRYTPKTYREYTYVNPIKPKLPSILPQAKDEQVAWRNGIIKGWKLGTKQAERIIINKIRTLESDILGMIRFHVLEKEGLITMPKISKIDLGVVSSGRQINIGEAKFTVSAIPEFNPDYETWKVIPRENSPIINKR